MAHVPWLRDATDEEISDLANIDCASEPMSEGMKLLTTYARIQDARRRVAELMQSLADRGGAAND